MRRIAVLLSVVGVVVACGKSEMQQTSPPANTVNVHFSCSNNGGRIGVEPWRVSLDQALPATWTVLQQNVTVFIIPKDPNKWPFISKDTITVMKGAVGTRNDYDPNATDSLYKYKVMGVCARGSNRDTVILDPDMIIPTRFQQ